MVYKFGGDIALLFIVWVLIFSIMSYYLIIYGYILGSIISFIGLIIGSLVLLHRSDNYMIEKDEKKI